MSERLSRITLDGLPLQVRSAGIAAYTQGLVRGLAECRPHVEIKLFGLSRAALTVLRALPADGDVCLPPNVRWLQSPLYPLVMGYPIPRTPRFLELESVIGDSDVFHGTNYVCPRARAPRVVTIHDLTLIRFPELGTRALRRLVARVRDSIAQAKLIITDSDSTRRDTVQLLGAPPDRVRVVHLGCDPRFGPVPAENLRLRERLGFTAPYILHVGTIEPRKNLPRLLRAYASLRRDRGVRHELVLIGARGWGQTELVGVINSLDLQAHVHLAGRVDSEDLPAAYAGADLFVYPSLYEGFGLPVLEAMACGTPVAVSNASSLPEVVGDAALLFDACDERSIADAIHVGLTNPSLCDQLRARGLERAKLFSWERCARETFAIYDEAVG